MFQKVFPRVCRKNVIVSLKHPRWISDRRNVPMFGNRRRDPHEFRSDSFFGKSLESHFRDMAKMIDGYVSRRPNYDEHYTRLRPESHERNMANMRRPYYDEHYARPKEVEEAWLKSEVAEVKYDSNKLQVKLDVSLYAPEELNVSMAEDRLVIKGKHEQRADDHGFVTREFTREFVIPENIEQESITSTLSEDGMLVIQGRAEGGEDATERVINIERQKRDGNERQKRDDNERQKRDDNGRQKMDDTERQKRDDNERQKRDE